MANGSTTTPMFKDEADKRRWAATHKRTVENFDKLGKSIRQLKWMAIFWVSLVFIQFCYFMYHIVVLVILQ